MAKGTISAPMLRIASAQNPDSRIDARRQVIHSGLALDEASVLTTTTPAHLASWRMRSLTEATEPVSVW